MLLGGIRLRRLSLPLLENPFDCLAVVGAVSGDRLRRLPIDATLTIAGLLLVSPLLLSSLLAAALLTKALARLA